MRLLSAGVSFDVVDANHLALMRERVGLAWPRRESLAQRRASFLDSSVHEVTDDSSAYPFDHGERKAIVAISRLAHPGAAKVGEARMLAQTRPNGREGRPDIGQ